jgi:ATP-dependent Clp protease ATP-binding subunit ClpA
MIENPLAVEVLAGHFHEGDQVVVRVDGETFSFTRQVEARPA